MISENGDKKKNLFSMEIGEFYQKWKENFLRQKTFQVHFSHFEEKNLFDFFLVKIFSSMKKILGHFFFFSKRDLFDFKSISSSLPRPETAGDRFVTRNNGKEIIISFERRLFKNSVLRFFSKN